jgi:hypothetical protein
VKVRIRMILSVKASSMFVEFRAECESLDRH